MSKRQRGWLFANIFKNQKGIKGRPRKSWGTGMTVIPPRPIWRRILAIEEKNVIAIAAANYNSIFK